RFNDSQVYGRNGQTQFGIDVLAILSKATGLEVGQCKCWEKGTARAIKTASDEFLPHLKRWRSQGIKRFVLFVACPLDDTKLQDQVLAERERFAKLRLKYEVWDARKLRSKLRPHPDLVHAYCGESWVKILCGL